MPDALSEARWAGIRAICEGQPPTHERVARATGVYVKTIARRAGEEEWDTLDFRRKRVRTAWLEMIALAGFARDGEELDPVPEETDDFVPEDAGEAEAALEPWPDEPPAARMARVGAILTRRLEIMMRRIEAGHPPESRQVTALANLVSLCERITTMAREAAEKERQVSDEDVAAALARINRRIREFSIELAKSHVESLLIDTFGIPPEEVEAGLAKAVEAKRAEAAAGG